MMHYLGEWIVEKRFDKGWELKWSMPSGLKERCTVYSPRHHTIFKTKREAERELRCLLGYSWVVHSIGGKLWAKCKGSYKQKPTLIIDALQAARELVQQSKHYGHHEVVLRDTYNYAPDYSDIVTNYNSSKP